MKRYRIGLVGVHSTVEYPLALRMGVQNTLSDAGHVFVPIVELVPNLQRHNVEAYLRVACKLAARLDLDAVIVPAGCFSSYLEGDTDTAVELTRILDPAKTLVLERIIPGYRCIAKDNDPGMHECMRHLIEKCGCRKIAFISGPEHSQGAREREAIYFEEMAAHGLETPSSLFARGLFSGLCADVIEEVVDNNPDLDAIACSCDRIAYTAYEVLNQRKIAIGTRVAVTGFDDHPRSSHMDPPLSTVHMTSYDYGCMAAREAIRLCEGKPQEECVISSTFVARNSCGEDARGGIRHFRDLLRQEPFPEDEVVRAIADATLVMASRRAVSDFEGRLGTFFHKVRVAYNAHRTDPHPDDALFSPQDLTGLFLQEYAQYLSLEGFHSVLITFLEALVEESPFSEANWVVGQISFLHLHISRLMGSMMRESTQHTNRQEWITFHMVDDALRMSADQGRAFELVCSELRNLGIRDADLFRLAEPIDYRATKGFALSDAVYPLAGLRDGEVYVARDAAPVGLQELLCRTLGDRGELETYAVGGIMAGNELLGVAAFDPRELDLNAQFMVFMNLGIAFKHLQLIVAEREMNQLLSRNNLQLQRQSQHDEMTGLLNRRGFASRVEHLVRKHHGSRAAVLYLDLDGLKGINDTLGHDVGDEAIRNTARALEECLPAGSVLCRMGGDEFGAFVPLVEGGDAKDVLEDVQKAMAAFNSSHDTPYSLSISAGMCEFRIDDEVIEQLPEFMATADMRLYNMKRAHKAQQQGA